MSVMTQIKANEIKMVPVSEIVPNPKNPNIHTPEQIERLVKLINFQGFRNPLIVSKRSGFLVAGHGRLEAAVKAGLETVPVIYQDFDNEAMEYAYVVSDNAVAEWATLDLASINAELPDLGPFDIDLLGIKDFTLDISEKLDVEADDTPDTKENDKRVALGDLWTLGNHRLLCGDSTDITQVNRLMNGDKIDIIFTDPPYGINLDTSGSMGSTSKKYRPILGDDKPFDPQHIFNLNVESIWLWGANYYHHKLPLGGTWIVWDKKSDDEINTNLDGRFGNDFELLWTSETVKMSLIRKIVPTGYFAIGDEKRVHPTQKPVRLVEHIINNILPQGLLLELYLGSGSTLIACEKTNRRCFGMELDPQYCAVILDRWVKFTGNDPIREDGIKWSSLAKPD